MNLMFIALYLKPSIRVYSPQPNGLSLVIQHLTFTPHNQFIANTFRRLLTETEEALIISKAAMHCLQYLCDQSHTRKEANEHLQTRDMDRNYRKICPWKWHRRPSCCDLARKPVLAVHKYGTQLTLTTYGRLYAKYNFRYYRIYSLQSLKWTNWRLDNYTDHTWFEYLSFLKHLISILSCAGRFPPLIHLCRTKSFALMSMMFPDQSRRARRAIGAYLNRMDAGIVEDDQGKKTIHSFKKKPNQSLKITQDQIVTLQRRQGSQREG